MQKKIVALSVLFFAMLILVVVSVSSSSESYPPKGQIVFSALTNKEPYTSDGGRYDLFLQAIPSGKTTRLTNHQANPKLKLGGAIREPLFSHNGKRILFLANYADLNGMLTMTGASPYPYTMLNVWQAVISNHSISSITKGDLGWHDIAWSPDDRFFSAVYPSKAGMIDQDTPIPDDIYVYNIAKLKKQKLTRVSSQIDDLFWSLDGRNVLFQLWSYEGKQDPNLYTVPMTGDKAKTLIKGKGERFGYSFSPDKRRLAFIQDNAVYTSRADGSDSVLAIQPSNNERSSTWSKPRWSKTGDRLAVAEVSHDTQFINYQTKLHVYNTASRVDRVIANLQQHVTGVFWSNDGQWLVVKILKAGNTDKPDPKTGWYTFNREGLLAVSVADGHIVLLKEPTEETKGLDWFETAK